MMPEELAAERILSPLPLLIPQVDGEPWAQPLPLAGSPPLRIVVRAGGRVGMLQGNKPREGMARPTLG